MITPKTLLSSLEMAEVFDKFGHSADRMCLTDLYRNPAYVYMKITEELFELNDEIRKKKVGEICGKDGIMGESIDFIISIIDFIFLIDKSENVDTLMKKLQPVIAQSEIYQDQTMTETEILTLISDKLSQIFLLGDKMSVATQILGKTSYKTPETFGFSTKMELVMSIFEPMLVWSLQIYNLAYKLESDLPERQECFDQIWLNKMSKWRKWRKV